MTGFTKNSYLVPAVLVAVLVGCASSVTPVLKFPLLKEGEAHATITLKHAVTGPRSQITAFLVPGEAGEIKAYAPISTETIGKSALKAAYAWTPWGVATRMVHMNTGIIYQVPSVQMGIRMESTSWEGPIKEYVQGDKRYQVWRVRQWDSYIQNLRLQPGLNYALVTPKTLYGTPEFENDRQWSVENPPVLEIKKKPDQVIHVDEQGNQNVTSD